MFALETKFASVHLELFRAQPSCDLPGRLQESLKPRNQTGSKRSIRGRKTR